MDMRAVQKLLEPLRRGLGLMLGRAVINLVNDAGDLQLIQVSRLADETADGLERFGEYGLTSNPPAGSEAIVASMGGVRSHGIVIAVENRQWRFKGLPAGGVAMYDDQGQVFKMTTAGTELITTLPITVHSTASVAINAPDVTVTADTATVDADTVHLTGDGQLDGDCNVNGNCVLGTGATKYVMLADGTSSTTVKAK